MASGDQDGGRGQNVKGTSSANCDRTPGPLSTRVAIESMARDPSALNRLRRGRSTMKQSPPAASLIPA